MPTDNINKPLIATPSADFYISRGTEITNLTVTTATDGTTSATLSGVTGLVGSTKYIIYSDTIPRSQGITFTASSSPSTSITLSSGTGVLAGNAKTCKISKALDPYSLTWASTSNQITGATKTTEFQVANYAIANPYFLPTNEVIKFTPVFNGLSAGNKIIQCKWSFGDGTEMFISDEMNPNQDVLHTYIFDVLGSRHSTNSNVCLTTSLIALDKYQQVIRCQKTVYPRTY